MPFFYLSHRVLDYPGSSVLAMKDMVNNVLRGTGNNSTVNDDTGKFLIYQFKYEGRDRHILLHDMWEDGGHFRPRRSEALSRKIVREENVGSITITYKNSYSKTNTITINIKHRILAGHANEDSGSDQTYGTINGSWKGLKLVNMGSYIQDTEITGFKDAGVDIFPDRMFINDGY